MNQSSTTNTDTTTVLITGNANLIGDILKYNKRKIKVAPKYGSFDLVSHAKHQLNFGKFVDVLSHKALATLLGLILNRIGISLSYKTLDSGQKVATFDTSRLARGVDYEAVNEYDHVMLEVIKKIEAEELAAEELLAQHSGGPITETMDVTVTPSAGKAPASPVPTGASEKVK